MVSSARAHRFGRDAERGRLVAVELDDQARRGGLIVQARARRGPDCLGRRRRSAAIQRAICAIVVALAIRSTLLPEPPPPRWNGPRTLAMMRAPVIVRELVVEPRGDVLGRVLALAPVRQHHRRRRPDCTGLLAEPRARRSRRGSRRRPRRNASSVGFDLQSGRAGVVVARALRGLDAEIDAAAVLVAAPVPWAGPRTGPPRQDRDEPPRPNRRSTARAGRPAASSATRDRIREARSMPAFTRARQPAPRPRRAQQLGGQHRREAERQQRREERSPRPPPRPAPRTALPT